MISKFLILSVAGFSFLPMIAMAQISEVRIGVAQFDEDIIDIEGDRNTDLGRATETSVSISGEILFDEPRFLKWALSPQPYIGGSLNLEGNTSFAGAGLLWRQSLGKKFYGDFAVGLVGHTGTKRIEPSDELVDLINQANGLGPGEIPDDLLDAASVEFDDLFARQSEEIEFGSRVLFRLQGAIGYNLNKDWAGEVYIEHLSNGSVFSSTVNEGVNSLGIRAARKF